MVVVLLCGVVCCALFADGGFACAQSTDNSYEFSANGKQLRLVNITDGDKVVGVYFAEYYFGSSDIAVSVSLYDSPEMPLNFAIGGNLNADQSAVRAQLVQLIGELDAYIDGIDKLANTSYDGGELTNGQHLPKSEVYLYNTATQGQRLQISADTYNMLSIAQEMYSVTDGAYNPAVYRLVDLWGFSSRIYSRGDFGLPYDRSVTAEQFWSNGYPLPEQKYIEAFSDGRFVDFSQQAVILEQQGDSYFVTKNVAPAVVDGVQYDQWIDLGGIAKGYVVDGIKQRLAQLGLQRYNVDAGSSSMAYGSYYDGGAAKLGIADPFDPMSQLYPTALLDISVQDCSISSSGQNVRKYTTDGVEYAHILDGSTGRPAQTGVRGVTVVVPDGAGDNWAAKSDCLTTALTVLGREGIVQFVNGYLKQNNIGIVVCYQTSDGRKQLLTNYDKSQVESASDAFDEFGWALERNPDGTFVYNADARFNVQQNTYKTLLIVLGCLLGVAAVALVVYHFVRGRKSTQAKVEAARRDKPFRIGDVLVYMAVVLLIAVLFVVFVFDKQDTQLQTITVIDEKTGEVLYVYNMLRGESVINTQNSRGWVIEETPSDSGVQVRFSVEVDGEQRYNVLGIDRTEPSAKMLDAVCGFHKDCVRNFPAVTRSGGAIVCSPNRLKVVTE